ncbi:hypothetical protein ACN47E_006727 [Coniothyrium glycines]
MTTPADNGHSSSSSILTCFACFQQAGIDTTSAASATTQLKRKLFGLCNAAGGDANTYDLLTYVLAWLRSVDGQNPRNPQLPAAMAAVTSFADRFTSFAGINEPTTTPPPASSPSPSPTSSALLPQSTPSAHAAVATYLPQLPANWPYTAPAVARHAGQVASSALTLADADTRTVAWLCHSLLWNPRPVHTPFAVRAAARQAVPYQPLLEGWVLGLVEASAGARLC